MKTYYLIQYRDPKSNDVVELKAQTIQDSSLGLTFVCVSDFIFDTKSIVVQPSEEQLQKSFEGVKKLHLNIYSIISIREIGMDHLGLNFKKDKSNLIVLPKDSPPPPN